MQSQGEEIEKDVQKIILVGDASTGKTNIIYTYTRDKPPNNIMPTIAVEFSSKVINLDNTQQARVQIWDTAGQEVYRSLTMNHYRKVNGALIVFDVTRRSTFEHVSYWLENLQQKGSSDIQIGLIGHKIDNYRRQVSTIQGEQLAAKEHIFYAETTINDVNSIKSAFKTLITNIIKAQQKEAAQDRDVRLEHSNNENSSCSC